MKILFLHDNFPAQFGKLGEFMANLGWDVVFGTQRTGVRHEKIRIFNYKAHREITKGVHPYIGGFEKSVLNGQAVARAALDLKNKHGYSPDIVVAHSGWGPGLFVKDVWPDAKYVGYFEWFYNTNGCDIAFMDPTPQSDDEMLRTRVRNAPLLSDLASCDVGICPTRFQKSQFPACFDNKLIVQHDGVMTTLYKPKSETKPWGDLSIPGAELEGADEIITYVARGMEPYRGFPQFMEAVSILQKLRPNVHVVIAGEDRVAYGKKLDKDDSFKKRALAEFDFDESRLHFLGLIPPSQYLALLQASSAHIYLTVPFVLSWSMMEAMSVGCVVIGSDTEPVRELIDDGKTGVIVDYHNPEEIAQKTAEVLAKPEDFMPMRKAARDKIVSTYSAQDIYRRKEFLFSTL